MNSYLQKMEANITLAYVKTFFSSLLFFIPIWYAFETQFTNPGTIGIIYALAQLVTVILELPTGALADLIGRKKTIFLGLLIQGVSWIYISQAKDVWWLWVGYLGLNAVGNALISGADVALIFDSLKELGRDNDYAKLLSKTGIIFRAGLVLSTSLGGYLFGLHLRLPYLLVGLSSLIAGGLTLLNTEPRIDTEQFSLKAYLKQTKLGVRELTKNDYIRDFSIYYIFVGGITWYFIYFLDQSFATEVGFTAIQRSWLSAGIFLLIGLIDYKLVRSEWLTRNKIYLMYPTIIILGALPGFWIRKLLFIPCAFLIRLAGETRYSILDQYTNKEFESKYRATAISALNMGISLVFSGIAIVGGRIIDLYGPGLMMTLLGLVAIITTVPTAAVLLTKHRQIR